jgi:hypothetical protein
MTGFKPESRRLRTRSAIVAQFSAVATLLPPNFITTHRDSLIVGGAPMASPGRKSASSIMSASSYF